MKCLFGGSSMRKEFLLEENAMLQRMLFQEQREKMSLQEQLHAERIKCALLEQEISHVAAAAQEMGDNLAQYFNSQSPADTHMGNVDQDSTRPAHAGAGGPFAPGSRQLQCIPEHTQKQQEILDYAESVREYAANLQQRLAASTTASPTPAAAAAAEPGACPDAQAGDAQKVPSRTHSISVPSELQASMDLPLQALAVSRLALQLHQPQGQEDDTSFLSSSGRQSSSTALGNSMDFGPSSISSFPSLHFTQHPATAGAGLPDAAQGGAGAAQHRAPQQPVRSTATRCSVTRNAAAIAGSCASIAAAAAATAAAAAARKAAAAAAMADRSQAQAELRASTESGFSSLTSPGGPSSISATLRQRREWQLAQEQWQQAQQEQSSSGGSSHTTSARTSPEPDASEVGPRDSSQHTRWPAANGAGSAGSNSSSSCLPRSQDSSSADTSDGQHRTEAVLPRLPAVPRWVQHPVSMQTLQQQQQQPRDFRYGSIKMAAATAAAGAASAAAATVISRPPIMHHVQARGPQGLSSQRAAGPLHRNLGALSSSMTSLRVSGSAL